VEVTRLPDEMVITPPQEIDAGAPLPRERGALSGGSVERGRNSDALTLSRSDAPTPSTAAKRSWLTRLIPFRGKAKPAANTVTLLTSELEPPRSETSEKPAEAPAPKPAPPSKPLRKVPRYAYLSPAKPLPGNHQEAEPFFAKGLKAHRAEDVSEAQSAYQRATKLDPAYFEAWHNLGLAYYELGKYTQSLRSYETALALKADSVDARYNFGLALKQAGYLLDAAAEFARIVKEHPEQTRAHLSLANLCAHQLQQPGIAREHCLKVLELEPQHPQASEIRYWLGAQAKTEE
jgi:tetratricopeptide (TPR) repeat protein